MAALEHLLPSAPAWATYPQVLQDTPLELFAPKGTGCDFETRLSIIGEDVLTPTDRFYLRQHSPTRTSSRSRGGCGSTATGFTRPWCQGRRRPARLALITRPREVDRRQPPNSTTGGEGRCLPCPAGPPRANDR